MKKITISTILIFSIFQVFAQQTGILTDARDGQVYETVKIGNQWWMAENLNYKTATSKRLDNTMSVYNGYPIGQIYNGFEAEKVCPNGWHLPSISEWKTLVQYLGGSDVAGGKMKTIDKWQDPNRNATNSSGFSAYPASYIRHGNENTNSAFAYFWASNTTWSVSEVGEEDDVRAFIKLNTWSGDVSNSAEHRKSMFSIRCIKD